MAGLSKTFSGDFTGFLAGKLWDEIKRRAEENEIDKRQGDPAVKKAAKELLKDDPKAISVKDPALRERVSMLFGAGLDVKLIRLEDKANELSSSVSTLGTSVADTHKLISDQNEVLEEKFDEILKIFGKENELEKKKKERAKASSEELELEEGSQNFGSRALLRAMRKGKGGAGGLLGFLTRRAGSHVVKRLLQRYVPRRIRARGRMIKGIPGKFRRNLTSSLIRRIPGTAGKKIRNVVLRETAEGVAKRGIGKQLMKQGGKVGSKKIPGLGWIAGSIFAVERALKGDFEGAGLEILSGLAGSIPTVGTGVSLGIDSYIIARDIEKGNSYESGTKNAFTKKGPGMLHGQEVRLTKGDRDEVMDGFMNSLNTMGAMLTSVALTVAQSAGAETDVKSQMIKDGLDYSRINISFNSDLGRVKTTSYDIEKEDLFMGQNLNSFSNQSESSPGTNPLSNLLSNVTNPIKAAASTFTGLFKDHHHPDVIPDRGQPGADFTPKNGMNRAVFPGKVVQIGHDYDANKIGGDNEQGSGYGNFLVIRSVDPENNQPFDGLYAHFPDGAMLVGEGDDVVWGQNLGRMGIKGVDPRERIGSTTAPHTSLDFLMPDKNTPYTHYKRLINLIDPHFSKNPYDKGTGGGTDDFGRGLIRSHEAASGAELTVYADSEGYPTVGYGHLVASDSPADIRNLTFGDTITAERAESLFDEDYEFHKQAAMQIPGWGNANARQRAALIDLTFNMGPSWHLGFPSMVKAMEANDWKEAARNLKYSDPDNKPGELSPWMGQVGTRRSTPILSLISGGGIPKESIHLKHLELPDIKPSKDKSGDWARAITDNFGIKKGGSFEFQGKNGDLFRAKLEHDGWHIDKHVGGLFPWQRVKTWGKDNNQSLKSVFIKAGQDRIKPKATLSERASISDLPSESVASKTNNLNNQLINDSFEIADLMEKVGSGGLSIVFIPQIVQKKFPIHISSNNRTKPPSWTTDYYMAALGT